MTTVTVDTTLVERPTVYGNTSSYNVAEVLIPNVTTPVGGGAGAAVTTSIAFGATQPATTDYNIDCTASQACSVNYANKAVTGFDFILTPLSSGVTLSAGTADLRVTWKTGSSS